MKKVSLKPKPLQGTLASVVAHLSKQAKEESGSDKPDSDQDGVQIWNGAPGGGYAPPPSWVPADIRAKYKQAWDAADEADMVERGYDPENDDGLSRSEGAFGEASGFTAIAPAKQDDVAGIDHFTTEPIPFTYQGKKLVIWGGVSGL